MVHVSGRRSAQRGCAPRGRVKPVAIAALLLGCTFAPATPARSGGAESKAPGLRTDCRSHSNGKTSGAIPTNMVLVPGGSFVMGLSEKALVKWLEADTDTRNQAAELLASCTPASDVVCPDLLIDKHEVSNLQFKAWLDAHGLLPDEYTTKLNWSSFKNGSLVEGIPPGQETNPMRACSVEQAVGCLAWMGKRLPTEVEWAYVASRGLKPDQAYPWGGAVGTWDPTKSANSSNSSRGPQGPQTFPPGSWKEDVTIDGVFDLCGNVAEWTSSPFLALPGFKPIEIKDGKTKRMLRGRFDAEEYVLRGGSYFGNHITNNVFWRKGERSRPLESVGFRGAMSALPGLDALTDAQRRLTLMASEFKGRLDLTPTGLAGQEVQYVDPDTSLVRGAKQLAFTRVSSILAPMAKVERDSIETPALLGILTVSTPIAEPRLPAGSYGIFFKGKGVSEEQKRLAEEAKKEAKDAKKDEKKDDKKKPAPKGGTKKGGKDEGKDAPADEPPAEDPKAAEEAAAEAAAKAADRAAEEALESIGAKAKVVSLIDVPTDVPVLLFKDAANNVVAWLPAKFTPDQAHAPVGFDYAPGAAAGPLGARASAAKGGQSAPMMLAPEDVAHFVFTVKMGGGIKFPRFELPLRFEAGSFEPVK